MTRTLSTADLELERTELESKFIAGAPHEDDDTEVWDEYERLLALDRLRVQLDYCWNRNATLIADTDWVYFCEDMAYDIGEISKNSSVTTCVDWEKWANMVRQDYKQVNFNDETWWVRA
jgi:hypothetical protein